MSASGPSDLNEKRDQILPPGNPATDGAETPCLIVDGLCRQLGDVLEANFERDGGDGLFPPPSLHALLSLYLISGEQQNTNQGSQRLRSRP